MNEMNPPSTPTSTPIQNKSWFEGGNPKMMFVFGFVSGVALISLIVSGTLMSMVGEGGVKIAKADTEVAADADDNDTAPTVQPTAAKKPIPAVTDADHIRGNKDAKVVLVEYSDFQCPYCARHHPNMVKLMEEYGDDIAWVYRHFPLSFHAEAEPAAVASECASEQGKFWEYADKLIEGQKELGEDFYIQTAKDLGLNATQFESCLGSGKYDALIASQTSTGSASGVTGTPATFLNGQLVSGAVPYASLAAMVDDALAE